MKTKEIAVKYGIDRWDFERFLRIKKLTYTEGFASIIVDDGIVETYVNQYKNDKVAKKEAADKAAKEEADFLAKKQKAMSEMLITSGFNFDGYVITKYSGYISGDDAISIDRGTSGLFVSATDVSESLTNSLVKIRRQAIKELKEAAYNLGCNAVIGVDFDYITLEPETSNTTGGTTYLPYVFCVTANGNAVVIEKKND